MNKLTAHKPPGLDKLYARNLKEYKEEIRKKSSNRPTTLTSTVNKISESVTAVVEVVLF